MRIESSGPCRRQPVAAPPGLRPFIEHWALSGLGPHESGPPVSRPRPPHQAKWAKRLRLALPVKAAPVGRCAR